MADPAHVLTWSSRAPDLTLRYGPLVDHVIDVRLPRTDGGTYDEPRPLVVVLHGGFWRTTYDRRHAGAQSAALADEGYVVATPEYRRVGPRGGGWPETFDDVAEIGDKLPGLVRATVGPVVSEQAPVVVGHSAGGHLALWSAARHRLATASRWHRPTPAPVSGVVSLAGLTDLVRADALRLGSDAARALLGGGGNAQPHRYATASPIGMVPLGVPAVLVHGSDDDLVPAELSRDYARDAAAAGDSVELVELPGVGHYELIDPLSAAWTSVLQAVRRLSRRL